MTARRLSKVRRPLAAVVSATVLALAARLVNLGWRIAHQDEGRVADWTLHYMATGTWEYRPIIHGPFIPHTNGVVFTLFGASDFTMRLIPALIGGLLPLVAWLLRDRLRDTEVVGVALFLAANPILLYYSRFMRNDILLGGLAMFAFAFVVRAIDTGRRRYLYAAGLSFGLAMATKENVLLYPVTWAGALLLLVDHRLTLSTDDWLVTLESLTMDVLATVRSWAPDIVASGAVIVVTAISFYAPKPAFYEALRNPSRLPVVLDRAVIGSWQKFVGQWADPDARSHAYLEFAEPYWDVMVSVSLPVLLLGVLGFLVERYGAEEPRDLVAFCFYWAAASALGYPLVMDIFAAWNHVYAIIPLAVPAGVGVAAVWRRARRKVAAVGRPRAASVAGVYLAVGAAAVVLVDRGLDGVLAGNLGALVAAGVIGVVFAGGLFVLDREGRGPTVSNEALLAGLLVTILATAALQTGAVVTQDVYMNSQGPENKLIQYAQPSGQMQPALGEIERIAEVDRSGPDVMYYGEISSGNYHFFMPADYFRDDDRYGPDAPDGNEAWPAWDTPAPGWFSRLPLPWYTSQFGADVTSTTDAEDLADGAPPVVITYAEENRETENSAADIEQYLEGYKRYDYQLYQWGQPIVIFVESDA